MIQAGPAALTAAQKAAGRVFSGDSAVRLAALPPPGARCSPYIREYRHACPHRGGASLVIRMREHYELSPAYVVCYCGAAGTAAAGDVPHEDCQGSAAVAAGLFAYIWTDGKCSCGLTVRSSGHLVYAPDRPPDKR